MNARPRSTLLQTALSARMGGPERLDEADDPTKSCKSCGKHGEKKYCNDGWKGFSKMNLWKQDKGQKACAAAFVEAVKVALENTPPELAADIDPPQVHGAAAANGHSQISSAPLPVLSS